MLKKLILEIFICFIYYEFTDDLFLIEIKYNLTYCLQFFYMGQNERLPIIATKIIKKLQYRAAFEQSCMQFYEFFTLSERHVIEKKLWHLEK